MDLEDTIRPLFSPLERPQPEICKFSPLTYARCGNLQAMQAGLHIRGGLNCRLTGQLH